MKLHTESDIPELIKKSKENVEDYFVLEDGSIIFNGLVFRDKAHLERYFKSSRQTLGFFNKLRRFFGMKQL